MGDKEVVKKDDSFFDDSVRDVKKKESFFDDSRRDFEERRKEFFDDFHKDSIFNDKRRESAFDDLRKDSFNTNALSSSRHGSIFDKDRSAPLPKALKSSGGERLVPIKHS